MLINVDVAAGEFVAAPGFYTAPRRLEFKRGDSGIIEVLFFRGDVAELLPVDTEIILEVKETGKYDADPLIQVSSFVRPATVADPYEGSPAYDTAAIDAAFFVDGDPENDVATLSIMVEVSWRVPGGGWLSTNTSAGILHNDVIREGGSVIDEIEQTVPAVAATWEITLDGVNNLVAQDGRIQIGSWVLNFWSEDQGPSGDPAQRLEWDAPTNWIGVILSVVEVINTGAATIPGFTVANPAGAHPDVTASYETGEGFLITLTLTAKVPGLDGNGIVVIFSDDSFAPDVPENMTGGALTRNLALEDVFNSVQKPFSMGQIQGFNPGLLEVMAYDPPAARLAIGASADAALAFAVSPLDYGAFGDGASHPASSVYGTLLEAQAVYPKCLTLTEELDGLAIQKAMDTGRQVIIRNGYYKITGRIDQITRGQTIIGESATGAVLEWTTNSDGFVIQPHSNANPPVNGPGSITDQNTMVTFENLWLIGFNGAGSIGIRWAPRPKPPELNDWNGERITLRNINAVSWDIGYQVKYASKVEFSNTMAKSCLTYGYEFSDATNNCPRGERISAETCPIGMFINGVRGGYFHLADFSNCDTGIYMTAGNATFIGGELESFDDQFFRFDGAIATILSPRFLAGPGVPILLENRSAVFLAGHTWTMVLPAVATEIARTEDAASTITGPQLNSFRYGALDDDISGQDKVKYYVSAGVYETRALSPIPWINANVTTPLSQMEGMTWFSKAQAANRRAGSHLVTVLKNGEGEYYKSRVNGGNLVTRVITTSGQFIGGWEDMIKFTGATGNRFFNLRATTSADIRVEANNGHRTVLYNMLASGIITISAGTSGLLAWSNAGTYAIGDAVASGGLRYVATTAHTSTGGVFADDSANWSQENETINLVDASITLNPGESIELMVTGDGDWLAK